MTARLEPTAGADEGAEPGRTAGGPSGAPRAGRPAARSYRAPRLVAYGCLTDVTRFGGSEVVDSGTASLGQMAGG